MILEKLELMIKEKNIKSIIEQCVENYVSILNINYPFYFEYMVKKCLEFCSNISTGKYGPGHLIKLNTRKFQYF